MIDNQSSATADTVDNAMVQAEIEKIRAERDKARAEAHELNRPLYHRPGFWAALIPGLIAAVTAYFTLNSELFDAQELARKANLQLSEANAQFLKAEEVRLGNLIRDEKDQLAKEREKNRQATEAERAKLRAETDALREELQAGIADLQKQQGRLAAEKERMTADNRSLEQEKEALEGKIAELENRFAAAGLNVALSDILSPDARREEELIETLARRIKESSDRGKAVGTVLARAEDANDPYHKGALLAATLLVEENDVAMEALSDLAAAQNAADGWSYDFWRLCLIDYDWESAEDQHDRCTRLFSHGAAVLVETPPTDLKVSLTGLLGTVMLCHFQENEGLFRDEAGGRFLLEALNVLEKGAFGDLDAVRIAELIKSVDVIAADQFLGASLARLDFEIYRPWLNDYVTGQDVSGVPSGVTSSQPTAWREYWRSFNAGFSISGLRERVAAALEAASRAEAN